jgi:hypothetical protein
VVAAEVEPGAGGPENLAALLHAQLAVDEDVNHRVNLFGSLAPDPSSSLARRRGSTPEKS